MFTSGAVTMYIAMPRPLSQAKRSAEMSETSLPEFVYDSDFMESRPIFTNKAAARVLLSLMVTIHEC